MQTCYAKGARKSIKLERGSQLIDRIFTQIANRTAAFVGQPSAFVIALALILIWATVDARNEFIGIEHLADAQLAAIRSVLEREAAADDSTMLPAHEAVDRLIGRT